MDSREKLRIFAIHYQERLTICGEKQQPISFVTYAAAISAEQAQREFEFVSPAVANSGGRLGIDMNHPNTSLDIVVMHIEQVKVPGHIICLERTYDLDMPTEKS